MSVASRPARVGVGVVMLFGAAALAACGAPSALDLAGRRVDPLADRDSRATVLLFVSTDCPISNRYAPEVRRLHERFAPQRVAFWLVYPDPQDTPEAIGGHLADYGYPMPALRDPRHAWVERSGATVTPEAAVYDPLGRLAYRGRIDDRYVAFGRARPEPPVRDLERALTAVLEGRPVVPQTAPAVGCFIRDLR